MTKSIATSGLDGTYTFEGLTPGKGGTIHVPYVGLVDFGEEVTDDEMVAGATLEKNIILTKGLNVYVVTYSEPGIELGNVDITCVVEGHTLTGKTSPWGSTSFMLPYHVNCKFTANKDGKSASATEK